MNAINAVADFVAMPDPTRTTWQRAVLRGLAFMMLAVLCLALGDWLRLPLSIGWMFGYAWGALTVYGTMRPHLRS